MRYANVPANRKITDFLGERLDFAGMGNMAVKDSAMNAANIALNNARTADTRMMAAANVEAADHYGDATRAAGSAQGQAAMASGFAGIGGVLGGMFSNMGGGGGGFADLGGMNTNIGGYGYKMSNDGFISDGPYGNYASSFGSSYFS